LVLEPGDGGPLKHAPTLSTGPCQRAPVGRDGGTVRHICGRAVQAWNPGSG
jgi:hypothetical protein